MAYSFPLTSDQIACALKCPAENVKANWPILEQVLRDVCLGYSENVAIAALATVACETAHTFKPIHEYGPKSYFAKYDGRADLGNVEPGDGYLFRGRGFIQITGRANYKYYGNQLGIDLMGDPEKACDPIVAADILAAFFRKQHVDEAANVGAWSRVRKIVNGGYNGLEIFLGHVQSLLDLSFQAKQARQYT